jgi:hypothetical protein
MAKMSKPRKREEGFMEFFEKPFPHPMKEVLEYVKFFSSRRGLRYASSPGAEGDPNCTSRSKGNF